MLLTVRRGQVYTTVRSRLPSKVSATMSLFWSIREKFVSTIIWRNPQIYWVQIEPDHSHSMAKENVGFRMFFQKKLCIIPSDDLSAFIATLAHTLYESWDFRCSSPARNIPVDNSLLYSLFEVVSSDLYPHVLDQYTTDLLKHMNGARPWFLLFLYPY